MSPSARRLEREYLVGRMTMARRTSARRSAQREDGDVGWGTGERFKHVIAVIVALENYRKPSSGDPLPAVEYAHADADAFGSVLTGSLQRDAV
jgi:hypothetical protein